MRKVIFAVGALALALLAAGTWASRGALAGRAQDLACRWAARQPDLLWWVGQRVLARLGPPQPEVAGLELALRRDGDALAVEQWLTVRNPRPACREAAGDVAVPLPAGAGGVEAEGARVQQAGAQAVLEGARVEREASVVIRYRLPLPTLPGEAVWDVPWALREGVRVRLAAGDPWDAGLVLAGARAGQAGLAVERQAPGGHPVAMAARGPVPAGQLAVALAEPPAAVEGKWGAKEQGYRLAFAHLALTPSGRLAHGGGIVVDVVNTAKAPLVSVQIPLPYDPKGAERQPSVCWWDTARGACAGDPPPRVLRWEGAWLAELALDPSLKPQERRRLIFAVQVPLPCVDVPCVTDSLTVKWPIKADRALVHLSPKADWAVVKALYPVPDAVRSLEGPGGHRLGYWFDNARGIELVLTCKPGACPQVGLPPLP